MLDNTELIGGLMVFAVIVLVVGGFIYLLSVAGSVKRTLEEIRDLLIQQKKNE